MDERRGRPTNTRIPLAYDYRRVILLIQILATTADDVAATNAFINVAGKWDVSLDDIPLDETTLYAVLKQLAKFTLKHAHTEKQNGMSDGTS